MKKFFQTLLSLLLTVSLLSCGFVSKAESLTYTTAPSTANYACLGYDNNEAGPISIVNATLSDEDGSIKDVYLIGLSGTAFVENQATGLVTDFLAGFNLSNPYLDAVVKAVTENIPAGSNLIFTGHSLGGMIAQEAAADSTLKANYNILYTVTFGAPLISALSREGTVKRLADQYDYIAYLSVSGTILEFWQVLGLNREDGGYGSIANGWDAHCNCYSREDEWGEYDVLGFKYGCATLTYDLDLVTFYKAPTQW